jgi:integrase
MPNLTDTLVKKLAVPTHTKKTLTRDGLVTRFMAQVTRDGCRSFVIRYSVNGVERLYTIGRFPEWPTEAAREEAKRLLRLVDQGIDPKKHRDDARAEPTVKDLAARFLEEHAPTRRPSYLVNAELILRRWMLPTIGNRKISDVGTGDVDALFRKVSKTAPIMANRVLSCGSKMFSLAERWGLLAKGRNPFHRAVDRNNEMRRQVYLKPAELVRLTDALRSHKSQQAADAVRLLMLTGCRRGEALSARVDQIDLVDRVWRKPASSTKQNRPHEVPLSAPALELLTRLKTEAKGPYLFPSADGKGHMTELKTSWRALSRAAGITGVRLHDLRHTFASIAVSRGATLPLVGALLGHSNPSTTARYAHLFDSPQRAVAEGVAAVMTGNTDDKAGEVVPIGRGRGR